MFGHFFNQVSSLQSEHLGVVVGHSASFATGGGGALVLACDWQSFGG